MKYRQPLIALIAVLLMMTLLSEKRSFTRAQSPATSPAALKELEVVKPVRSTLIRWLNLPGSIEAYEQADLFAKVTGYVSEVRVDIGDRVTTGHILARVDVPELSQELAEAKAQESAQRAMLRAAEAKVAQAEKMIELAKGEQTRYEADLVLKQATFRRSEELQKGHAITEQDLDEVRNQRAVAEAQVEIARAKIAAAEADLGSAQAARAVAEAQVGVASAHAERLATLVGYMQIVAPFDGVITRRWVDRGALVQAATGGQARALFSIQRVDTMRTVVEVPESDAARVRTGVIARVKPFGSDAPAIEGKVNRTSAALNNAARSMRTEIDLPNPESRLLPGSYAQISLAVGQQTDVLSLPASAVFMDGKQPFVNVVQNGRSARVAVKPGIESDGRIEITGGLAEDSVVIAAGSAALMPGTAVKPLVKTDK